MVLDQPRRLPDDALVAYDQAGIRVSLGVSTPYLNRELAEFAGAVSERIPVGDGGPALLRAVLVRLAPKVAARSAHTGVRVPTAE